ncbi:MAG: peptide chain release factor 2 [Bacilli bacterium]|nr:peptide chain release factor 2 [Bacilli bacterium]
MNYGGHFDIDGKQEELLNLENEMADPNFWNDKNHSEEIIAKANSLRNIVQSVNELKLKIENDMEIIEILKEETNDELSELLVDELPTIESKLNTLDINLLLDGPYDSQGAILEIHAGAGGTEACDWADMLLRMYLRWCDKKGFKYEIVDKQVLDEAGFKSATILIKGMYAFGYLKSEKGVHRLIRISPFDSNSRRHTSFASVDIEPIFDNNEIDIQIKDSDVRIDIYRSSGCGGQGVNTTDSAVRITHLETGIVVTCQNERSQIQNKETAMNVLKSKLYKLELEKREQELKGIQGNLSAINFGSQIRTYTMHPYSLVKDHRTNWETANVGRVLDGDLDDFIDAYLKQR